MPNICSFAMFAKGQTEDLKKFINFFMTEYGKEGEDERNTSLPIYFARTWLTMEPKWNEDKTGLYLTGWCAWSVWCCMFAGYTLNSTTCPPITDISKELNLTVQIASEEPGTNFTEFYEIENGEVIEDCCEDIECPPFDFSREDDPEYECEYQDQCDALYSKVYEKMDLFDWSSFN